MSFVCEVCGTNLEFFKQYYNKVLCEYCYNKIRQTKRQLKGAEQK